MRDVNREMMRKAYSIGFVEAGQWCLLFSYQISTLHGKHPHRACGCLLSYARKWRKPSSCNSVTMMCTVAERCCFLVSFFLSLASTRCRVHTNIQVTKSISERSTAQHLTDQEHLQDMCTPKRKSTPERTCTTPPSPNLRNSENARCMMTKSNHCRHMGKRPPRYV